MNKYFNVVVMSNYGNIAAASLEEAEELALTGRTKDNEILEPDHQEIHFSEKA